jgi:hypothetical protein
MRTRTRTRLAGLGPARTKIVLLASLLVAAVVVPAAVASTLAAEVLTAEEIGVVEDIVVNCGPTETSPFTYHVEGAAAGPHSGTFTEDGRVVPGPAGELVSLDATFTIVSAAGNVAGEKHFLGPADPDEDRAICGSAFGAVGSLGGGLCYRAHFEGGGTEQGFSELFLVRFPEDDPDFNLGSFNETFLPDPNVSCQGQGGEKVTICHRPGGNPEKAHSITVEVSAVPHHLAHGDTPGPCQP